ncbi:MAG TPA: metallophosphoesterase [Polyangiaceae bacterium]
MRSLAAIVSLTLAIDCLTACDRTPELKRASDATAQPAPELGSPPPRPVEPPSAPAGSATRAAASAADYRLPSRARLVAIGDIHGDLAALRATLRLAGAIDGEDGWIGKDLTVVQTGDQLDRGDQDREVLDLLEKLEGDAKKAGCELHVLNGNHELMNAAFDFRYVTAKSFRSFAELAERAPQEAAGLPGHERGRAAAFAPGASYALKLAQHLTVAVVGETLFAHGGVLPAHVDYGLSRINREAQAYLAGKSRKLPAVLSGDDSLIWTRVYGDPEPDAATCQALGRVLEQVGAKRMVVGHTVQKDGISSACQQRLFRIDVGLSAFYGDHPAQVLELTAAGPRVLTAGGFNERPRGGAPAPGRNVGAPHDSALH